MPYIDWTFFFGAWELKGRFPAILDHPRVRRGGAGAVRQRPGAARRGSSKNGCSPRAASTGSGPPTARRRHRRLQGRLAADGAGALPMLRQQEPIADGKPNRSLADFVAPRESGVPDYLGAFAVTAGIGADELARQIRAGARTTTAPSSSRRSPTGWRRRSPNTCTRRRAGTGDTAGSARRDELIDEKFRGIRPAFGYPACPDHSEKTTLFRLLDAPSSRHQLTESFAMPPAASVSGMYLATRRRHISSRPDRPRPGRRLRAPQGCQPEQAERWLAPNLGYEPSQLASR